MEQRRFTMETTTGTNDEKKEQEKKEFHSFYDIVRRMMLAGIGAVALTHDEIEEFIDKLVDRGEIARKDREELIKEMRERYKKYHKGEEHPAHKKVAELMERFSVPTKDDIAELNKKLSDLEKKIDKLSKTKG
jgi:polyhydroxyalkanoate synthesis regulator phasin